tara:strand:- start:3387 stop:5831 length:2445 start_codon:yes stop_codon:yes gene_type:complete
MAIQRVHQNSFTRGEVDETVVSRTDVQAFQQALRRGRNIFCLNQGAMERRQGTLYRADLNEETRLEAFIFNENQEYILAFQNTKLLIFSTNGTLLGTLTSCPWTTSNLFEFTFTQSADTMIVAHTAFRPQLIVRTGATTFTKADFQFATNFNDTEIFQPYFKFADSNITLDIDQTTAQTNVNLVTSVAYWDSTMVGNIIRYHKSEIEVTAVTDGTNAVGTLRKDVRIELDDDPMKSEQGTAKIIVLHPQHGFSTGASITVEGAESILNDSGSGLTATNINGTFTITVLDDDRYEYTATSGTAGDSQDGGGTNVRIIGHPPTKQWDEEVYNTHNGFPTAVRFHQQRLFFAGGSISDFICGSQTADFFHFGLGDGDDTDAIQINIASDQVNRIQHLISGKHLEIFTTTGEFYLKPQVGKPITPTDLQVLKQSDLGSQLKCMPRLFDGAAIFVQPNGKTVREYFYNTANEEYTPTALSILSPQAVNSPTDSAIIKSSGIRTEMFMLFVNDNGTIGVFSANRQEKLSGWVIWETDGDYISVGATTKFMYAVVKRTVNGATKYYLEQFSNSQYEIPTDASVSKVLSSSYQPHGTPLVKGAVTSANTVIIDGLTQVPRAGEQFTCNSISCTIQNVATTSTSGEYIVTVVPALTASDNASIEFTTSYTFTGLNASPDLRGKVVHATSGTGENDTIVYYGSSTVDSNGVAIFQKPASGIDIGIDYTVDVSTLSIDATSPVRGLGSTYGLPRKIGKTILELSKTHNLQVNSNDVIVSNGFEMTGYTGKKDVHSLGYSQEPFITITQSVPLPFRILSITSEYYF